MVTFTAINISPPPLDPSFIYVTIFVAHLYYYYIMIDALILLLLLLLYCSYHTFGTHISDSSCKPHIQALHILSCFPGIVKPKFSHMSNAS